MTAPLEVLFRDARWIAVAKPVGITTTPGAHGHSLVERIRAELVGETPVLHPLSRLDYDVTGVVLVALDHHATMLANRARGTEGYRRTYSALVCPAPSEDTSEWRWPIGIHPRDPNRRVADGGRSPQPAHTVVNIDARRGSLAALSLEPRTGRTHQLRAHCERAGCPILGDRTYGGARRITGADGAVFAISRVLLHCTEVSIEGGPTVRLNPPDDFDRAWNAAGS